MSQLTEWDHLCPGSFVLGCLLGHHLLWLLRRHRQVKRCSRRRSESGWCCRWLRMSYMTILLLSKSASSHRYDHGCDPCTPTCCPDDASNRNQSASQSYVDSASPTVCISENTSAPSHRPFSPSAILVHQPSSARHTVFSFWDIGSSIWFWELGGFHRRFRDSRRKVHHRSFNL